MKLPLKWLQEYTDYDIAHDEFVERMLWRGFEVAEVKPELADVENVVVAKIKSAARHPNADKLSVCEVDVGGKTLTIVCGAPNVRAGMLTPAALPGAKLPGGITITPTEMRGVVSNGMLCSGKELGITDVEYPGSEFDGILDILENIAPGTPIDEALGLTGVIFDIEITPNRPDCQSIIGMSREIAAMLNKPFREPTIKTIAGKGNAKDYASVTVLNEELCPRYAARVVTDINIAPSPLWMQKKLRSVGLRPINNIVDITNLVMVEYGHPMHAFDLACVEEGHIVVRNAYENETVRTLDSKDRPVDPSMLLIADPKKGVGIAGVMGGENSEIKPETKAVLFESAVFKGSNIRHTARKLRHITDAAARFIKGVEPVSAMNALNRAMELVHELNAGKITGETIDACSADLSEREIYVDIAHINKIINCGFTGEEMADMLKTISINSVPEGDKLHVYVPHFRPDIESGIEADWDISEEIARIHGFYNIEPTLMRGDTFSGRITREFKVEDLIKDTLAAAGLYEMYNYNFLSPTAFDALLLPENDEKRNAVRIMNPFGEHQSLMRTLLLPGMLKSVELNINRHTGHGRLFEVGNIHIDNNPVLAEERKIVGLAHFGPGEDFFTLKGAIEELLHVLNISGVHFVRGGGPYLHPGRSALVYANETLLGELGEVHPAAAAAFGIDARVYTAELSFKVLQELFNPERRFTPLPRYPVVERDIAVIADEAAVADELKDVIANACDALIIENVCLFDVFRGGSVPEGKKSMAFTFTLRLEDRTLQDDDITFAMNAIIEALKEKRALLRS